MCNHDTTVIYTVVGRLLASYVIMTSPSSIIVVLTCHAVDLFTKMWSPSSITSPAHQFTISKPCPTFSQKYDKIQDQLQAISGVDELLSGNCFGFMLNLVSLYYTVGYRNAQQVQRFNAQSSGSIARFIPPGVSR